MSDFQRIGVVGCGQMGAGFAEICARRHLEVVVAVPNPASADRGAGRLRDSLGRLVRKGKLAEAELSAVLDRIRFVTDVKDLADRQFVVEAITERLPAKVDVFSVLDRVVEDHDAVLASLTSSIPILKLAQATRTPGRVVGVHMFNPVPVMPLVELISSLLTLPRTVARTSAFVVDVLGKQVVHVEDRPGFLVNTLLVPYLLSAVRLLDDGAATAEDIDRGMTLGCAHPMGPLALIDMIGLDVIASIGEIMYEDSGLPAHAPPALLLRMVEAGLLGRKTGAGFHVYS